MTTPAAKVSPTHGPPGRDPDAANVAILIPCHNEALTIAKVVQQFRAELPNSKIYVFDNNSSDRTVEEARDAGAIVFFERRQGKGYVVQSMFHHVEADFYVMVDGDGTYPARSVRALLKPALAFEADMVVGSRLDRRAKSTFKLPNRLGNWFFLWTINFIFRVSLTDILSGYRVFTRRFVTQVPLFGSGFEIETELTIKALERGLRVVEVPTDLTERPPGSFSKIRVLQDGALILNTILALFRDYRPLTFFGGTGFLLMAIGLIPGGLVVLEFAHTAKILHLPSAVLAVGLELVGMLLVLAGLILHTIVRRFQEFDFHLRALERNYTFVKVGGERRRAD